MKTDTYIKIILTIIAVCLIIIVLVLTRVLDLSPKETPIVSSKNILDTIKTQERPIKRTALPTSINPKKEVVDFSGFSVGDRYRGGVIIRKKSNELLICSPKPIGDGGWDEGRSLCKKYKKGGLKWRLPTPTELELVFSMRNYLDYYELNWYWTNNTKGGYAEHIGIQRLDHMFVPKEHGKFVFAVTNIKGD